MVWLNVAIILCVVVAGGWACKKCFEWVFPLAFWATLCVWYQGIAICEKIKCGLTRQTN